MAISWHPVRVSQMTMVRLSIHRSVLAKRAENGEDVPFSRLHGIISIDNVIADLLNQVDKHRAGAARAQKRKAARKAISKAEN